MTTSTIIYEGDLRTVATHVQSGTEIETDAPTDNKGKGERFSPTDLVATALGACMATTMGIKARDLPVDLHGMKLSIQKIMKPDPRRIAGINAIGIGSDFDGIDCAPVGLEDVSKFPNLTRALLENGYSAEDIRKIYGGNLLRVMKAVEKVAAAK